MNQTNSASVVRLRTADEVMPIKVAESALATEGEVMRTSDFRTWFEDRNAQEPFEVNRIPFDRMIGWSTDPATGNLRHDTGRFFTVEGLDVVSSPGAVSQWSQPIINQPEVGILGILVKEIGGVLHLLMQAKAEPGNCNGVQLSPTVQATRSNFTGAHRGREVPYLEYFRKAPSDRVVADVLQSEQGAWFYRKRNRNMVVEVREELEVMDGFCWLTLGQVHELMTEPHLVNMDARTVLSCLPFSGAGMAELFLGEGIGFHASIVRSASDEQGSLHTTADILSWITDSRSVQEVRTRLMPLAGVGDWHRTDTAISHDSGLFFSVVALDVRAGNREVATWTQPMIEPHGVGIVAFLVRRICGVLHALVNVRMEPGFLEVVELAPTVQCTPENYANLPDMPLFLKQVLDAPPENVRFDVVMSEEGGRFLKAETRYLVVEADDDEPLDGLADFRWMTVHQLLGLMQHSHYVNVQARSLVACLHSLSGPARARLGEVTA